MQIVGEGNDREQQGQDTDHRNRLQPHAVSWIFAGHTPAESPQPDCGYGNKQPNKIKRRLHCLYLLLTKADGPREQDSAFITRNSLTTRSSLQCVVFSRQTLARHSRTPKTNGKACMAK